MRTYLRALAFFRPDGRRIAITLTLIAAATAMGLLQVYPFAILADCVFAGLPPAGPVYRAFLFLSPPSKTGQIAALAVAVLLLRVGQELLQAAHTLLNIRVGYAGLVRVRGALFAAWQSQELAWHRDRPAGDAVYRLMWDAASFQSLLNVAINTVAVNAVTLVVMVVVMASQSVPLTLLAVSIGPPLMWVTRRYESILRDRSGAAREAEADLTAEAGRFAAVISVVQAFGQEAAAVVTFCHKTRISAQAYLWLHRREVAFWLLTGLTFAAGTAGLFGVGGYLVYRDQFVRHLGPAGMTIGKLSIFLAYSAMLYGPLKALSGAGGQAASSAAGVKRVFEVLDRQPTIRDGPNPLPRRPRTVSLEDVSFAYGDGPPVLERVNLTVHPGELVAIVGRSGAGKTTLLGLLPRLHDPTTGTVRLDGHDLRTLRLADVRRHVAVVSQDAIVLPGTVWENIAYGRPDATDADVRAAAALAGAAGFIAALPDGYDTLVADGGGNLSGGQRQRLAIARAVLTDAPILVLDEPTSALDAEQEERLVETIRGLRGVRTVIVVSHRPGTVAGCDRTVVIDGGRVGQPLAIGDAARADVLLDGGVWSGRTSQ
jgi:ABC-type multidrug transport system fused ATPase/permease subunit